MKDKKSDILDYPVSSFIVSKEGKQLTTKRVLFHIPERLEGYDPYSKKIVQSVLPPISVALCPTPQCVRQCKFCSNKQRNARNCMLKAEYNEEVFNQIMQDLNTLGVLGVTIAGGGRQTSFVVGSARNGIERICLAGKSFDRRDFPRITDRQRAGSTDF